MESWGRRFLDFVMDETALLALLLLVVIICSMMAIGLAVVFIITAVCAWVVKWFSKSKGS